MKNLIKQYDRLIGAALLSGTAFLPAFGAGEARPNILLIHCDQQRFDCLSYNGNPIVRTPNIDRLASQGMRMNNAFTPIPTSCPARQTLLTGQWPEIYGGLWNYDITLPTKLFDSPTWSQALTDSGYANGYVGKWHVHPVKDPTAFGFRDYVGLGEYPKWRKANNVEGRTHQTGPTPVMGGYDDTPASQSVTHWMVDRTVELIEKYHTEGKPWHVRIDHTEPHLPCFPAKEFYERFANMEIPAWGNFADDFKDKPYIQKQMVYNWGLENYTWQKEWQNYMRSYYAIVEQMDDAIGKLMQALEKRGLLKNTVVIYTTDHGDAAGSHRMLDKHYVMYQEIVHIPMIVRWDGVVKPGTECNEFVICQLDLATTFVELAGVNFPTQGRSLVPLLKGQKPTDWRKYAFSNYNGQQFGLYVQRMIFDGRYKYVWNLSDTDELYDLESDPWEMSNLIPQATAKSADPALAKHLATLRKALYNDLQLRNDPIVRPSGPASKHLLQGKKL